MDQLQVGLFAGKRNEPGIRIFLIKKRSKTRSGLAWRRTAVQLIQGCNHANRQFYCSSGPGFWRYTGDFSFVRAVKVFPGADSKLWASALMVPERLQAAQPFNVVNVV